MDPDIIDSGVAWYAGEVTRHALLHLPWIVGWLLGTGVVTVLGVLIFGRGYKKKIAALEEAERKRKAQDESRASTPAPVVVVTFNADTPDPERELRNAVQAETVQGLRETINRLAQHPLGDGHTYANLPEGTNIVTMADGTIRLALPVKLAGRLEVQGTGRVQGETSGQITPKDTITERGVLTLYESGYVKSLTPWKDLEDGTEANHPAGPPPRATWKDSPGAGRLVAQAIRDAESLETAGDIFDAHYASPNRQDTPAAAVAFARRMEAAGEDSTLFLHKMYAEGVDITDELGRGES